MHVSMYLELYFEPCIILSSDHLERLLPAAVRVAFFPSHFNMSYLGPHCESSERCLSHQEGLTWTGEPGREMTRKDGRKNRREKGETERGEMWETEGGGKAGRERKKREAPRGKGKNGKEEQGREPGGGGKGFGERREKER